MKVRSFLLFAACAVTPFSFAEETKILKDVSINVCDRNLDGCASYVEVYQHLGSAQTGAIRKTVRYLLDTNYPASKDFLENYTRPGDVMIQETMGVVVKEKGHFPNPMAEFEVFKPLVIIPRPLR